MRKFKATVIGMGALALFSIATSSLGDARTDAIAERLEPVGKVCMVGEDCSPSQAGSAATTVAVADSAASTEPSEPREPEQIYNTACFACHAGAVPAAPTLGDATAWQPRIDKGMDALFNNVWNGFNAMPPKGACVDCSEEEIRGAIQYMVDQAQ